MIDFPIIDSHIHLLDQKRFGYAWAEGEPKLKRDWTVNDLANSAKPYEIEGLVFVEVDVDMPQYLDEAEWVEGLAALDRRVMGAVVCLPLERGAKIEPDMARVAKLKTSARRPPADPEPTRPGVRIEAGLSRGDQAPAEIQPLLRRLHPASANAEHARP